MTTNDPNLENVKDGDAKPPVDKPARLASLDGLRAVSIGLVVLAHLRIGLPGLWRFDLGNLGVRFFFVISGFLITTLLLAEREKMGAISLPRFYFRRTFRIMPAFYAYLAVVLACKLLGFATIETRELAYAATYIANYFGSAWLVGHSWSLSVEEQFYLLWPALLLLGVRIGWRAALAMLVISPVIRTVAAIVDGWPTNPRVAFECVADALATGCLLARFRDDLWSQSWYRRLITAPWGVAWPALALAISALNVRWPLAGAAVGISALNLTIGLGVDWSLRNSTHLVGRVLNSRPFVFVGALSYSIYLWQQPFLGNEATLAVPLRLLGIAACALVSYYLVEKPCLALRSRLEPRIFGKRLPHAPPATESGSAAPIAQLTVDR